jgi:hypothetical protein
VSRAYNMFRACEGMEGEKIKINKIKIIKCNTKYNIKF